MTRHPWFAGYLADTRLERSQERARDDAALQHPHEGPAAGGRGAPRGLQTVGGGLEKRPPRKKIDCRK